MVYLDCVNTMLRSITEYQIANQIPIFTVYYLQRIVHISCLIFIIIFFFFKIKVASNFLVPRMSQWNQVENLAPLKKIKNLPIRSLLLLGLDFLFRKWQILYGKQIKMRRPPPHTWPSWPAATSCYFPSLFIIIEYLATRRILFERCWNNIWPIFKLRCSFTHTRQYWNALNLLSRFYDLLCLI